MEDQQARRVRAARIYADLSREELAKRLEVSARTQTNSELGKRRIPRPELLAIAEACEVPMWFLEGGWENYPASVDDQAGRALADIGEDEAEDERGRRAG
jgi:transcriptional regulator with XRE-family HTH domain